MSPYASNLRTSAANSAANQSSSPPRSPGRKPATRVVPAAGFTHFSSVSLGLDSFWDLGVVDRLQAPLTHYHE